MPGVAVTKGTRMTKQNAVLIDATLHNELVLRNRTSRDVSHTIEIVLELYLERTEGDDALWERRTYIHGIHFNGGLP